VTTHSATQIGRPRNEVRDIVIAAVFTLIEGGATLSSLTLVRIAEHSGISRNSLYRRWQSKDALYSEVVASMKYAVPDLSEQSAREKLVTLMHADVARAVDGNELSMRFAIMAEAKNFPHLFEQYLIDVVAPFVEEMKVAIRRGKETGEIRIDIDEGLLCDVLSSTARALTVSSRREGQALRSTIQRLTDLVFDGATPK